MIPLPAMSPWQQYIWDHGDMHWMLLAGRRKGKSYVCSRKGVHYAVHARNVAWYCANRTLADENWEEVVEFCSPFATRVNRASLGIMEFDNPDEGRGIFRRKTGWGDSAGRAGTLDFVIFDEAQLMSKKLFNRTVPSLATRGGHIAMTLTPPETPKEFHEAEWIKRVIDTADDKGFSRDPRWKNWLIIKSPTMPEDIAFHRQQFDRAHGIIRPWKEYLQLGIDALDEDRALLGDDDFDREFRLKWSLDTSCLVYDLIDGVHRKEDFEYDPTLPVRWAVDRGEGNGYHDLGMFQVRQTGEIRGTPIFAYRFFDEISTKQVISEDDMLNNALLLSSQRGYRAPEWVFYDARAPGYRKAILDAGLRPYTKSVGIEDGIRVVRRISSRKQLEIHPRCKMLWQSCTDMVDGYRRDEKGIPMDDGADAPDMMRYGVWMSERISGVANSVAEENQQLVEKLEGSDAGALLLRI